MAKIASPISHLFKSDVLADNIMRRSDCLECRDAFVEDKSCGQLLHHSEIEIIHEMSCDELELLIQIHKEKTELQLISFHMASSCSQPGLVGGVYERGGYDYLPGEMLIMARRNIEIVRRIFDNRVRIAVENNNYHHTGAYEYITDPEFIWTVVHENNIDFLMDIAHAKITAHNKGIIYDDYVHQLPLERLVQIHSSLHGVRNDGFTYDAHACPDENCLCELVDMVQRYGPQYVTIEYYKDPDALIGVLQRLRSCL